MRCILHHTAVFATGIIGLYHFPACFSGTQHPWNTYLYILYKSLSVGVCILIFPSFISARFVVPERVGRYTNNVTPARSCLTGILIVERWAQHSLRSARQLSPTIDDALRRLPSIFASSRASAFLLRAINSVIFRRLPQIKKKNGRRARGSNPELLHSRAEWRGSPCLGLPSVGIKYRR